MQASGCARLQGTADGVVKLSATPARSCSATAEFLEGNVAAVLLLVTVLSGRSKMTSFTALLQGLEKSFDYKKVLKAFKKGMALMACARLWCRRFQWQAWLRNKKPCPGNNRAASVAATITANVAFYLFHLACAS